MTREPRSLYEDADLSKVTQGGDWGTIITRLMAVE